MKSENYIYEGLTSFGLLISNTDIKLAHCFSSGDSFKILLIVTDIIIKVLKCGHSLCKECIPKICYSSNQALCPLCKSPSNIEDTSKLGKLLKINLSFMNSKHYLPEDSDLESRKQIMNIETIKDYRCPEHNSPIHSYNTDTLELYCSLCLNQAIIDSGNVMQLTEIVSRLRNALNSQRIKKGQNLLQVEDYKLNLQYDLEMNKEKIRNKINQLFDRVIEQVNFVRTETLFKAEEEFETYKTQVDEAINQIDEIEKEIKGDVCFINYLCEDKNFNYSDLGDAHCLGSITDYYGTVINQCKKSTTEFIKKIPAVESKLNIELDDEIIQKCSELLMHACTFNYKSKSKLEFVSDIDNCFDISKFWYCPTCKTKNSQNVNDLQCSGCKVYKPIELYQSFFSNKRYSSDDDIKNIKKRIEMEKECIIEKNKSKSDEPKSYFFINEKWMKNWEMFALSKVTEYSLQTTHNPKEILFIPYPGSITNSELFNPDNTIRDDVSITSFRVVNPKVWNSLFFVYKGGPEIHRTKPYIYSPEVAKDTIGDKMRNKINKLLHENSLKESTILALKEKSEYIKQDYYTKRHKYASYIQTFSLKDSPNSYDSSKTTDDENDLEINKSKSMIVFPDLP